MFALRLAGRRAVRVTAAFPRHTAVRPMSSATGDMFCFQCEQTEGGTGCTTVGVCGKTATTAGLQDVLVHSIKGLAVVADDARKAGLPEDDEVNDFTTGALFSTLTNVNFDADRFAGEYIPKANELISRTRARYEQACAEQGKTPSSVENTAAAAAVTLPSQADELLALDSEPYSVTARRASLGDEAAMMQELVMYGLKGTAAYLHHANVFKQSPELHASLQETLAVLGRNVDDFDTLLGAALGVGALNFEVLKLLDEGHTERFGHPVPTPVSLKPKTGKCILVSGHDMADLDDLLNQVKGTDISVYTHGEMLPAHGYPNLHKHENLAGHLFGAWQMQRFEFTKFPGPILVTSNCIVEPRSSYQDRVYTTNAVGWPGLKHVTSNPDGSKDYSALIEQAMAEPGFTEKAASKFPEKSVTVGFGHNTVLGVADQVIDAVKAGKLNHIFFIGGCDGAEGERSYFKELAQSTPSDSLILTAGCGKYRFNRLELGTLGDTGLPRVLDMGQCNDSYSAIVTAVALAKAFDTDVNGLPLSFAVSWFEQKAVAVLLTLLHLGVKNIHLGPNLPAFVTPKLLNALVDNYGLAPIGTAQGDLDKFLAK